MCSDHYDLITFSRHHLIRELDLVTSYDEKELLLQIAEVNERVFKQLFKLYGKLLYPFLFRTVKSKAIAEELIQLD